MIIVDSYKFVSSAPSTFDMTIVTTGASQDYAINIQSGISPNITVDWGDGLIETFTTTGIKSRTYSSAGTYNAKLYGSFASGGNIRLGSNATNRPRLKSVSAFPFIPGLNGFQNCIEGGTGLTGAIPADLFRYNPLATNFQNCLQGCSNLTGTIPADLFRYNTLATNFSGCLQACSKLTGTIPADLFRYNILATLFTGCLQACSKLTGTIPADLFRYNILATDFTNCLRDNNSLTGTIPADLFRYNTLATNFTGCLQGCTRSILSQNIFSPSSEYATRFLNQSVNFTSAFNNVGTLAGSPGIAPELWLYSFGTGTPTRANCFAGSSLSTATNYADIPIEWRT
jgi:hypothetical protein